MKPWNTSGLVGVNRFLERVWNLSEKPLGDDAPGPELLKVLHKTIKKVSKDTDSLDLNTAISQMMIFVNEVTGLEKMPRELFDPFVRMLSAYAPHLGEELWRKLGHADTVSKAQWPDYNEALCTDGSVTVVVQINGKLRDKFEVPAGTAKEELEKLAFATPKAIEFTQGKKVVKVIVVQDKLVNIVVAG
jgi:leucyl-tRNA synthetase